MLFVPKQPHLYHDSAYDYNLFECCGILFRGPPTDFKQPYICCVGNSFTFGRFVSDPYPAILARLLGKQVLNLGFGHLTPEKLQHHPVLLKMTRRATAVVAQFRFEHTPDRLEAIRPTVLLNWDKSMIRGMLNIPFERNSNGQYPDQASHEKLAIVLYKHLDHSAIIL